jgi:DNA-binding SARP family transcriptional activator
VLKKVLKLAKLTRPRLHKVLARYRLFALLDAGRERPVIWIAGPPGCGKTALVGSYLDAREIQDIWVHLDGGDQDLATFFYYLSQTIDGRSQRGPLPIITPEHLGDVQGFTRYYFREFFARMRPPVILVFDNYQEIPESSALHAVLQQAALEAPEGVTLVMISRKDPPAEYSRLDALDRLARIEWNDLKLTLPEASSIAALRCDLDAATLKRLYDLSNGWAAGLTLALEQIRRTPNQPGHLPGTALESVFNYFAGQILKTAEPDVSEFLLRTALFPRTTVEMARQISGSAQAGRVLEYFYRHRLFTDRRGEQPFNYQYHDLFRTFLLDRLVNSKPKAEVDDLRRQAGAILEGERGYDDAFALYRDAADWSSVARLVLTQAQELIAQGRGETLREWAATLPAEYATKSPWLSYWQGISLLASAPDQAIDYLVRANEILESKGEASGQIACCTAIILAHLSNLLDFTLLSKWVDRLIELLRDPPERQAPLAQLRANAALAHFAKVCQPRANFYQPALKRTLELLTSDDVAVNDKVLPACFALQTMRETCHFAECDRIIAVLHPQMTSALVSPGDRAYWYQVLAWTETSRGDRRAAAEACREAETICTTHSINGPARRVYTHMLLAANALQARDLSGAQLHIEKMETHMRSQRSLEHGWANWIRSIVCAMRDDWDGAVRYAEEEIKILTQNGAVFHLYFAHLHHAAGLVGQKRYRAAHQAIEDARALLVNSCVSRKLADVDLMAAWLALSQGASAQFERHVQAALALLRSAELHACLWYVDQRILPGVLAEALRREIAVDQIRAMIRKLELQPPPGANANWPWPVRVRLLGGFQVWIDDVPLESSRKPPRKLLALLKALACSGDSGVPESQLIDWLWPESEADAARKSLQISLHRLRAALGKTECVIVADGRIRLDRNQVWVDAWAFDSLSRVLHGESLPIDDAVAIYQGTLLPGDMDAAWCVSYREQLRDAFNRLIYSCGARLESQGAFQEALRWYAKGIEADDLVEGMYQGLMRCYLGLGQAADAQAAYQRLRRTLTAKLRAMPSKESVALAHSAARS